MSIDIIIKDLEYNIHKIKTMTELAQKETGRLKHILIQSIDNTKSIVEIYERIIYEHNSL